MTAELILLAIAAVSLTLSVWLGRRRCEHCHGRLTDNEQRVHRECWEEM